MKSLFLSFFCCISFFSFGQIEIIYQQFERSTSNRNYSTKLADKYIFTQDYRIWSSDGTKSGTGIIDLVNTRNDLPVVLKNELYYLRTYNENITLHLHKTNGTIGQFDTVAHDITDNTELAKNDSLVFFIKSNELWRSDGTKNGTFSISTPFPNYDLPKNFVNSNNLLLFVTKEKLWKSDGLSVTIIQDYEDRKSTFSQGAFFNGYYYFQGYDESSGFELWRTDGTTQGTQLFMDLDPTFYSSLTPISTEPNRFLVIDNELFFVTTGTIWKTDGTVNGTVIVKKIPNSESYNQDLRPFNLNGKYVTDFLTSDKGNELWVSDGTENGTFALDINPNGGDGIPFYWSERNNRATIANGYLYFMGNDGQHGRELWRTDGTIQNTTMIMDKTGGIRSSDYSHLQAIGNELFFFTYFVDISNDTYTPLAKLNLNQVMPQSPTASQQPIEWLKTVYNRRSGSGFIYNGDLAVDSENNIYFSGEANGERKYTIFANDGYLLSPDTNSTSRYYSFLAKYDEDGQLLWSKDYGSRVFTSNKCPISIDSEDNVLIADHFWDQAIIDGVIYNSTQVGMFVAKLDKNGDLLWSSSGNFSRVDVYDIQTDENNEVYVFGAFSGTGLVEGKVISVANGGEACFMAKYSKDGQLLWIKSFPFFRHGNGQIIIKDKTLYVMASRGDWSWWSSCEFSDWIIHLGAYDTENGDLEWEKNIITSDIAFGTSMDIHSNGLILVTGRYRGTLTLDDWTITSPIGENCHKENQFYVRVSTKGKILKVYQETENVNREVHQLLFDEVGNYYTMGIEYFDVSNEPIYYNGYESQGFPYGDKRIFIRKHDYSDNLLGKREFYKYGSYRTDEWYEDMPRFALTTDQKILLSDVSRGQLDTLTFYNDMERDEVFLLKMKDEFSSEITLPTETEALKINLFPNPTDGLVHVEILDKTFLEYQLFIYDSIGRLLKTVTKNNSFNYDCIDMIPFSAGTYFLKFQTDEHIVTKEIVIY